MHCFTAKTSCAVLDVLGPPYNDSEKRHCTYYNAFPFASTSSMFSNTFQLTLLDKSSSVTILGASRLLLDACLIADK